MRVLLINPKMDPEKVYSKRFKKIGAKLPPLGLCYLAAVLEQGGHAVGIIDANCEELSTRQILERVDLFEPDIIGLTAVTLVIEECERLAEQIKAVLPHVPIAVGGPHISGYGKDTLLCKYFDFGIIGEGEYAFLELVKKLEAKENYSQIRGLIYRVDGKIVGNGPTPLIEKLDDLPHPSRHLLPDIGKYYTKVFNSRHRLCSHILTSRGCPYRCIFCHSPFGKEIRLHSPEYVADEIAQLAMDYGVKDIKVDDDIFNWDTTRIFKIFDILKHRDIKIPWSCNLRVDLVKDKSFFSEIKKRRCWLIRVGLESGNQIVLDNLKKGINLEHGRRVCNWASEAGLKIQTHFIIANPLDSEKTMAETINFAKSLPVDYPTFTIMTPLPGTELWDTAPHYGRFEYNRFSDLALSYNPCFIPTGLSKDIIMKWHSRAYFSTYINIKMVIRHLKKIDSLNECRKLFKAAWSFLR